MKWMVLEGSQAAVNLGWIAQSRHDLKQPLVVLRNAFTCLGLYRQVIDP